ncbi:M1 family aminopeptidase [Ruthenibacterium sp. CLA-JM-H11]|uniref:M1 family aminopeptidase n=1 Tax=Ruthenibacterium intestinale TaxID=3133163 RepID=A0ABV1GCT5_9FIRM
MKTIRLFPLEFGRLLQNRLTWLMILLTVISPAAGLFLYKPATATTMLSLYLANPAIAGGVVGGILFGLLTIFELDRVSRSRADVLMDAAVSPLTMALVRLLALLAVAVVTVALTMLVWLPISMHLIGSVFGGMDFVLAYLLLMGLALPLSILAAAAAYQFTRRVDLSLVLFAAFAALSLTVWADDWQLCWLNPCVWALSDDFSNFRIFRSVAWMRLTWLAALAGVWAVSYLCIRQYGKGVLGSLAASTRRIYRPAIALLLLVCSGTAYAAQPLVDQSNPDEMAMTFYEVPYAENVVCTGRSAQVFPNTSTGSLSGTASYQFQNTSGQKQNVAFGINPGYTISNVQVNGADVPFSVSEYQEYNEAMLEVTLPADEQAELVMEYSGFPQESRNMSTMQGSKEISTEYLCLENSALSPRLMNVMPGENGYPATIEITLPASMTAIPFGSSEAEVIAEHDNSTKTWRYEANGTGGILYAGDYICENIEAGGMTIEFYYGRKHQSVMEAAGAVEAVKSVVDYCTEHYGSLSFGTGETLKLIQSRVTGGGYATNGASLLDEADFTADNLGNADKGGGAGEVMIHELVHQWWGLGNMFDTSDATSPWSAEGLTVYTTYRIVKELYGDAYAQEHYIDQWQQAVDDYYLDFYVRNPDYLANLPEDKQLEITGNLTYVRQYCEMPLKILKAEQLVGGEDAFDQILNRLFNRELDPMYPYLTYQDFLNACGLAEEDLNLD